MTPQNRWVYRGFSAGRLLVIGLAFSLVGFLLHDGARVTAKSIPAQLDDKEFWRISSEASETDGYFRSDNLLSNELGFQFVIPELLETTKTGRVYLGVGPEQNFTYIVALKPKMAFIIDIRRGNLDLQLVYKALFELSKDRADFVSRLFSRTRPEGLTARSTGDEIFTAVSRAGTSDALYRKNLAEIKSLLAEKHRFGLSDIDREGIDYVYNAFHQFGPGISYSSSGVGFGGMNFPSYWDLMVATDQSGAFRSYLANEESFGFLKDLESKNLIVPVVGNFAGPKAIRAVGRYLKSIDATVSAFYLSNVEQYLYQDRIWTEFCKNASTLPVDENSRFIRSVRGGRYSNGGMLGSELGSIVDDTKSCAVGRR
jgi:hypothetical protein